MLTLKTIPRKLKGKKTEKLRKQGFIPAVVYGYDFKPQSVQFPYLEFEKVYKQAGESTLINLEIQGKKPVKTLIYDVQYHPLTDKIQHVDFYKIKAGEKITVEVELKFVGTAPAVKELGGVLLPSLSKVEIECLPEDLIHEIEVDVSKLENFGDAIRVSDLKVPGSIKVLQDPEDMVVQIERPMKEEEKEVEEKAVEEKPEGVERVGEEEEVKEGEVKEEEKGEDKIKEKEK